MTKRTDKKENTSRFSGAFSSLLFQKKLPNAEKRFGNQSE
jgi:hypothetical protein